MDIRCVMAERIQMEGEGVVLELILLGGKRKNILMVRCGFALGRFSR